MTTTAACPACTVSSGATEIAGQHIAPNVTLSVPGMHCAACMGAVERALREVDPSSGPRVNLTTHRVSLRSDLPQERFVQALTQAGYQAYPLDSDALGNGGTRLGAIC